MNVKVLNLKCPANRSPLCCFHLIRLIYRITRLLFGHNIRIIFRIPNEIVLWLVSFFLVFFLKNCLNSIINITITMLVALFCWVCYKVFACHNTKSHFMECHWILLCFHRMCEHCFIANRNLSKMCQYLVVRNTQNNRYDRPVGDSVGFCASNFKRYFDLIEKISKPMALLVWK